MTIDNFTDCILFIMICVIIWDIHNLGKGKHV